MRVWRLVKTRYTATAFDGEGARLHGGRWNSVGVRVAYASSNSALAVLEVLVHLDDASLLPAYSFASADVPDDLVEDLDVGRLGADWSASPAPLELQALGDEWARSGRSLILRVPSVLVPEGFNVLINPEHRAFLQVAIRPPEAFSFDPRLLRSGSTGSR